MGRRPFDRAQDRRSRPRVGARGGRPKGKVRGTWSAEIRGRFLALLRETGNARAALRVVGHANMFYKRRRRDPEFAAEWAAAVAEADARLKGVESPFPATAHPRPSSATGPSPGRAQESPNSQAGGENKVERPLGDARDRLGSFAKADPATLLRPGPKKVPKERGHVIRRTSSGRVQIALARECEMTAEQEAEFLERLRATGNFSGSARAMGFQPASLFQRARKWPAFQAACDAALEEASVRLDYELVAYAHASLRRPDEAADEMGTVTFMSDGARSPRLERESDCPPDDDVLFDPDRAMRILAFLDRRRGRETGRGRRKGPPERSFDEAVASVLSKIEAISRHKAMMKDREAASGALT